MSTTTIRLPEDLKARVARAAERSGTTPHGFILEAIAEKAAQAEARADFEALAQRRDEAIVRTGMTVPWSEMRQFLLDKAKGRPAARPRARKLAR